ncbi:MAG: ATP phosphoribosyltransferase regulatory subunit [Candidatus Methylomirabilales bacterium]
MPRWPRSEVLPTAIPKGVRGLPPPEATRLRWAQEKLLSVFKRWGFREVLTPTFEYLEVFAHATGDEGRGRTFKFVDRQTGLLLALRSDLTPQVARMVATTMRHHPLPLRLAYSASVFRHEETQAGRQREFFQAGVELIGSDRPEADAEMISMAVEGCQEVGLRQFQIDVGQVEYLRGMLNALDPSPELRRKILSALRRKDALELEITLNPLPVEARLKEGILKLTTLYGGDAVLEEAKAWAATEQSRGALENLTQVYEILRTYGLAEHIIIDLGETYAFDYHTGVVFQVFTESLGYPIGGGGRYDNLIGQFGYPCPATGFAFELEKILAALEAQGILPSDKGPDFIIIDFNPDKRQALHIAQTLRSKGYAVARDIIQRDLEGSLSYARVNAIPRAIILGLEGVPGDLLHLRDVRTETDATLSIAEFCQHVRDGTLTWAT